MARRKTKKTRRRRKSGISLLGVAETIALTNAATLTAFNCNAYDFLTGGDNLGGAGVGGTNIISIKELMNPTQDYTWSLATGAATVTGTNTWSIVWENVKENWMTGAAQMVFIPLGFRMAKQIGRPAISRVNRLLGKAGVASTVKV